MTVISSMPQEQLSGLKKCSKLWRRICFIPHMEHIKYKLEFILLKVHSDFSHDATGQALNHS